MAEQQREDVAYLSDIEGVAKIPSGASDGNIPLFGEGNVLSDSGVGISEISGEFLGIWNAIDGVYPVSAYGSDDWEPGKEYIEGDFCRYSLGGYAGFRCIEPHTSGQSFDSSKWDGVLTQSGRSAIDSVLSEYSKSGLASILDLAPEWSSSGDVRYKPGQLVKKDGVLQICTSGGPGVSAEFTSSGANVDSSISERIAALDSALMDLISAHTSNSTIHVTSQDKDNWNGKQDEIADLPEIREDAASGALAAKRDKIVISGGTVTASHANGTSQIEIATSSDLSEKADLESIDHEFDTSGGGYSIGDTCTHEGKWYKCLAAVSEGEGWDSSSWHQITVKDEIANAAESKEQSDWDETNPLSQSYIKNKPTIPAAIIIDDTLTHQGQAADAKAAGDEIDELRSEMLDYGSLSYEIRRVQEVSYPDAEFDIFRRTYRVFDRTINLIEVTISDDKNIFIVPPETPSGDSQSSLARDFYIIFLVDSDRDVQVTIPGISVLDYNENPVSIYVPKNEHVTYRFTDVSESHDIFLATLFADPSYRKIRELERALDDIIEGHGGIAFKKGLWLLDPDSGLYYKINAKKDNETGQVDIAINQTGAYGPDDTEDDGSSS